MGRKWENPEMHGVAAGVWSLRLQHPGEWCARSCALIPCICVSPISCFCAHTEAQTHTDPSPFVHTPLAHICAFSCSGKRKPTIICMSLEVTSPVMDPTLLGRWLPAGSWRRVFLCLSHTHELKLMPRNEKEFLVPLRVSRNPRIPEFWKELGMGKVVRNHQRTPSPTFQCPSLLVRTAFRWFLNISREEVQMHRRAQ